MKNNPISAVLIMLVFLCVTPVLAGSWEELKGEHFIVYFTQDKKFAQEVLDKSEIYYRDIALSLGYPRYKEFWSWNNRVKIYIYPDRASFLKATNQPEWSQGMADFRNKQVASFVLSQSFLDSVLPHEMAHLIFRDFVGFTGEIPLWLDEGVAQWAEETKRSGMKRAAKELFDKDALLYVSDMMKLDIRTVKYKDNVYIRATRAKEGKHGVVFLSSENLINTYYLQAVSIVGFLIERYGSDSFAHFCRQLRDGKTIEEALIFAYPASIRSLNELEEQWRDYLAKN